VTEAEWLACEDSDRMIRLLHNSKVSERKYRLFACAAVRMVEQSEWGFELDERVRAVLAVAERFADGQATDRERIASLRSTAKLVREHTKGFFSAVRHTVERDGWGLAARARYMVAHELSRMGQEHERNDLYARAGAALADVMRECFGTLPLRPVTFSPAWRTQDVAILAKGIYEEKAFDRLPILADALQDAGCDNEEALSHCRGAGAHVRGCWALDLVLGKE
jgi:hypothetical protein